MSITTVTHLNFRGNAREALEFYRSVFGGELAAVTYADAHTCRDPAEADQVMWGQVASPDGFHVMAYDVPSAPAVRRRATARSSSRSAAATPTRSAATGRGSPPTPARPWSWTSRPPAGPRSTACSPTASASPGSSTSPSTTSLPVAPLPPPITRDGVGCGAPQCASAGADPGCAPGVGARRPGRRSPRGARGV